LFLHRASLADEGVVVLLRSVMTHAVGVDTLGGLAGLGELEARARRRL
jgi:hypothetical protein